MSENRDLLTRLLESAAEDEPSSADLARLEARLGPLLGPPSGPDSGGAGGDGASGGPSADMGPPAGGSYSAGAAATSTPMVLKIAGGFALLTAVGVASWWGLGVPGRPAPALPNAVSLPAGDASLTDATAPDDAATPDGGAPDAAPSTAAPSERPHPSGREAGLTSNLKLESILLERARQRLAARESERALAALERHQRRYPGGVLAEERERLAIECLMEMGRVKQARARARRFRDSFPSSVLWPRIKEILSNAP